jgi:ferredoxin
MDNHNEFLESLLIYKYHIFILKELPENSKIHLKKVQLSSIGDSEDSIISLREMNVFRPHLIRSTCRNCEGCGKACSYEISIIYMIHKGNPSNLSDLYIDIDGHNKDHSFGCLCHPHIEITLQEDKVKSARLLTEEDYLPKDSSTIDWDELIKSVYK